MYFEQIRSVINGKTYTSKLVRESYRKNGKVKYRTICNLSKMPDHLIWLVKEGLKGNCGSFELNDLKNGKTYEYGASAAFMALGLLTNKEGCPVGVEIFKGNVSDQKTVLNQVKKTFWQIWHQASDFYW